MRWPTLLLMAALGDCFGPSTTSGAGATSTGGTGTTGASGTGGTGGASSCNTTTTCADCKVCALNGPCAALWGACNANSACSAIDQCLPTCAGDAICESDCYANNPGGASDYKAANHCVYCEQCPKECAGQCK